MSVIGYIQLVTERKTNWYHENNAQCNFWLDVCTVNKTNLGQGSHAT